MPFFEDSIYNPSRPGWRVLVMRRWPRGVRKDRVDEWYPEAAPSLPLLKAYQDGKIQFDEFARRYQAELQDNPVVLGHLRRDEEEHGTVILLCWERAPQPCHRQVLMRLLEHEAPST